MGNITKLEQVSFVVRDLPRAIAFYRFILELPYIGESDGKALFQCGAVRLQLSLPEKSKLSLASPVLYYHVEDIQGTYRTLYLRGISFEDEPHEVKETGGNTIMRAYFTDTEGNSIAIQSEVPAI